MVEITAGLVKELREKSGAGMMDCKKALTECGGDIESSIDWLRKKGLATAAKKADRVTAEGLVAVAVDGKNGIILEINSETDFVSRNDMFQNFVTKVANIALNTDGSLEGLKVAKFDDNATVAEALVSLIASIGENLTLRRVEKITAQGEVCSYIHNVIATGLGKIGVIIDIEGGSAEVGKQIALHIAATAPKSLSREDLDQDLVEKEKNIQREMALQTGKPADIVEKMLEGRINKFYQEVCLLDQAFVVDPDKSVQKFLSENNAKLHGYKYFILGEGIEKEESNFAEEVAKVIQ